ncbi:LLM class flavin-dependent oxidoreductase [Micromonospora sp. WMMD1155]|uniref:LLM class flavin-dependent oxidoreductase n=1 Tax=Micromonospora sp. WMMD1155 TaxID=3016094 RepID=UPI00249AF1E7|nr:LLM class flavin-dependent oxidoreductase [Micromonospora sp. WMMD1155]WFE54542.1 LLM class flavin-dependent oxidoreductase [Micromonospora sp. WMMD1155]
MSDYGHDLVFGSFVTPDAGDPDRTVGLAVLTEQVGLDLVTFQDHPYQPAFLDTWTLLSYVAARTDRVHLAANVTNLPLRPPAVLARSVASLDLLSDGRINLGLGAGAFWDAIEAMGGRRLTPGQGVRALEEAIEIIRQVWDTQTRGGVRVDGEFHRVVGAKRGPAPAHAVPIWLGAYKPRMLQLTGRRADGWLPTLGYLQPGDLAKGNAMIDDAAQEAGRSPRDVRRLLNIAGRFSAVGSGPLNGPAEQWVRELTELALGEGVSTFILAGDDPDDLRRFAAEVAPAVRESVSAERDRGAVERPQGMAERDPGTAGRDQSAAEGGRGAAERGRGAAGGDRGAAAGGRGAAAEPVAAPAVRPSRATVTGGAFAVVPTPDDGVRRSDQQVWDESTRPTGPMPDPDRTYTPQEQATGAHLVQIHDGLRAELTQIHDLIDQVAAGEIDAGAARSHINTMTMRQNRWTLGVYCESYCRIVTTHHTIEDQSLFPRLRARDPRLGPVVDRLEQEHHVIHDVLEGVDRALVAYVGSPDGLADLRAAVDLLTDALLSHLSYEERELVEPLARLGIA